MFFDASLHLDDDEFSAGQDDREVVLAATSVRGSSLVHASQRLRQERAVVLSAVSGGPPVGGLGFHGFGGITVINMDWFWWWLEHLAYDFPFSWECHFIPIDELHHFSEG